VGPFLHDAQDLVEEPGVDAGGPRQLGLAVAAADGLEEKLVTVV
jgi:hypothetical protein